ncbi:MAG: hypothetical protein R6X31_05905, partial [Anaerolineae bacterium]
MNKKLAILPAVALLAVVAAVLWITAWETEASANAEPSVFFYDGFESGPPLGSSWTVSTTNQGRVVVTDTYPYLGAYSLLLDDYRDDATKSIAAAILTVDLSGQSDVVLDFWGRELGG